MLKKVKGKRMQARDKSKYRGVESIELLYNKSLTYINIPEDGT